MPIFQITSEEGWKKGTNSAAQFQLMSDTSVRFKHASSLPPMSDEAGFIAERNKLNYSFGTNPIYFRLMNTGIVDIEYEEI